MVVAGDRVAAARSGGVVRPAVRGPTLALLTLRDRGRHHRERRDGHGERHQTSAEAIHLFSHDLIPRKMMI